MRRKDGARESGRPGAGSPMNGTDAELYRLVLAELEAKTELGDQEIGIAVRDGVVTLSGWVRSNEEKAAVERAVGRIGGVVAFADALHVRDLHRPTDTEIAHSVADLLSDNPLMPTTGIKARVEHGWVTVEGAVELFRQKSAVETAIAGIPGVRGVINLIGVIPPEEQPDLPLKIDDSLVAGAIAGTGPAIVSKRSRPTAPTILKRVLAATDGSGHGAAAVITATSLAARARATLDILSVVETSLLPEAYSRDSGEAARCEGRLFARSRDQAERQSREAGADRADIHIKAGLAAPLVASEARRLVADLVVVGADPHPAVTRFLVGSTAERVLRLATCPVLVATRKRKVPFQRVLAAVDLSPQSCGVIAAARAIACSDSAALRIVHVHEPLRFAEAFDGRAADGCPHELARDAFDRLLSQVPPTPETQRCECEGEAGPEILIEAVRWNADLVVVGSHGFGFFHRLLLGSTSLHVLRHGRTDTIVVPVGWRR